VANLQTTKQAVAKKEIVTVASFMEKQKDLISKVLPKTITPERMLGIFTMILKSTPALRECTQQSLIGAVIQTAQLGLQPGNMGHIHLIPFRNNGVKEVQLVIGYKGFVELINRSGKASVLNAEVVYENDQFQYEQGLNPILRHIPVATNRGEKIGVYCIAKNLLANEKVFIYLHKEEVEKVHKASKARSSQYSPWATWPEEMWKKTAVKRISKLLPLSAEQQGAISADETIKTKFDKDMTSVPDETKWNKAEDAEVVSEEPQNGAETAQNGSPSEQLAPKSSNDASGLGSIDIDGVLEEAVFFVLSASERVNIGKNKDKTMTSYVCEDTDESRYIISRWGSTHEGAVESLCTFKNIKVGEFQNERQYLASDIEVA